MKRGITVIAALIAVLAVTSGAFAADHYLINSSSQIKSGAIALSDLSSNARTSLKGNQGPAGASGYEVRTWRYSTDDANTDSGSEYVGVGSGAIATVACSTGKIAIGGGYRFKSQGDNGFNPQALHDGSGVVASFPGRMDWNTNTVKPNDNSGWIVQVNKKVTLADMTVYAICVNAS